MLLENLYLQKYKILNKSIDFFYNNIPKESIIKSLKIGCELEFYITPTIFNDVKIEDFSINNQLLSYLKTNPYFQNLVNEQGFNQYEVITKYTQNLNDLAKNIESLKSFLKYYCQTNNINFNDDGIFNENDCGNALQFNISLHDKDDKNIFFYNNNFVEIISNYLLDATNFIIALLSPNEIDYKRYSHDFNKKLFNEKKYTSPINLCYGIDNRTCAIRITNKCFQPNSKRIEYRVASGNADIYLCLSAIIIALSYAISGKKYNLYNLIFGNAFDKIYEEKNIPLITNSLDIALKNLCKQDNYIIKKMQEFTLSS